MKNLLIVILITTIIIGGFYLLFGEDLNSNSFGDVLIILAELWAYLFVTLWILYRVLFKKVKVRSITNDILSGKARW